MSWNLRIINFEWINSPTQNQTINVSFRKAGSNDSFIPAVQAVIKPDGTILSPIPLSIIDLPDNWSAIELQAINICSDEEYLKVFNKLGDCNKPTNIVISNISDNTALISWDAIMPAPIGGYDWQLLNAANNILQQDNQNETTLNIGGLSPNNTYNIKIRTNCGNNNFSTWVTKTFNNDQKPGAVTLNCGGMMVNTEFHIGQAITAIFYVTISTIQQIGNIKVTAHDDKPGSLNGYRIYGSGVIYLDNSYTAIPFVVQYDGNGPTGGTTMSFIVESANGTQTCTGLFSIQN